MLNNYRGFFSKQFNRFIVIHLCWKEFQIFTILFLWNKLLTNDLKTIVMSNACEISNYRIVVYINIACIKFFIKSPRYLHLDKYNKFSSVSRSSWSLFHNLVMIELLFFLLSPAYQYLFYSMVTKAECNIIDESLLVHSIV